MAENTPMKQVQDALTHSEDGVDLTLIRWMLGMTPAERLQTLQRTVQSIQKLRYERGETDFLAILQSLAEHRVQFIVVGGISAVLQGAPIATFHLDVVHALSFENIQRLLNALDELRASYWTPETTSLKPDASHLASSGHHILITRFGPLDLLGFIGKGRGYDELLTSSQVMQVGPNLELRVLDLSMVIQTKEETGWEKDAAVLAILRRTLQEKQRG